MFVFKGISSKDMEVIVEEEKHFIAKASQRYNQIDIEGRNGAEFEELGYSTINRPIKVQILNSEKIDKILVWLDGVGDFIYNNRKTMARFYNEVEPIRTATILVAEFSFIRNPFWNKAKEDFIVANDGIIYNDGTIYSEPIVKLDRDQDAFVDFSINDVRYKYNFNEDDYVLINSEEKLVQYEGFNRNRQIEMGYIFPKLYPGENKIIINSGSAKISFLRKDRWL